MQKQIFNKTRVAEKFGIHPNNFTLARAICGDKNDYLPGIRGIGLTTVSNRFPFLSEEKSYTIEELVGFCEGVESKLSCYDRIVEEQELVRENYGLMQLYAPMMSVQAKQKINNSVNNFIPELNKTGIRAMFIEDGIGEVSLLDLFRNFQRSITNYKTGK